MKIKKNQLSTALRSHCAVIISIGLFSCLYLPFLSTIPYLDGNIDFVQSYDFYRGGFLEYFKNWNTVHPPLKLFITYLLFLVGGVHIISYTLIGFLFGILGIVAIYVLSKNLFNKNVGSISSLLLTTSGIFVSTSIFSMRDFLMIIFIVLSLYFYLRGKYLFYSLALTCAVLTKQTSLLLVVIVLGIELLYIFLHITKKKKIAVSALIFTFIPFIAHKLWEYYLQLHNKDSWQEWIFAETASKGTVYTIVHNLTHNKIWNEYTHAHWKQLFFLNFNWVLWTFFLVGLALFFLRKNSLKLTLQNILIGDKKTKIILVIILFCIGYLLTVLTLQTYTITRYGLPVLVFLIIGVSFSIYTVTSVVKRMRYLVYIFIGIIMITSLFFSIDPVSRKIWGSIHVLGESFYALNEDKAGNDGLTYNFQFLLIAKNRTNLFFTHNRSSESCNWVLADPNNDTKTLLILKLKPPSC